MKKQKTKHTLIAFAAGLLTSLASGSLTTHHLFTIAHADDSSTASDTRRPPRGEIPPDLAAKLTADQIAQLKAASTMDDKIALLKSWNIDVPTPPVGGPRGGGPGGPPNVSAELKTLLDNTRTASSDTEREAARQALRDYYKTTTDDSEREAIRRFFAHHPSQASSSGSSSSSISSAGVSQ